MAQQFHFDLLITEKHLDTFGHVNNATYLQIYEEARWDFVTDRGFGLKEVQKNQLGPVILSLELQFKREICNREVIHITSQYQGMHNHLVSNIHQEMINADGKVCSTLDLKIALFDLQARKILRPTQAWFEALGLTGQEIIDLQKDV